MKKNVKALILSLIATLALGSFAACDSEKKPADGSSTGSDIVSDSQENVDSSDVGGVEDEDVTISLAETESIMRFESKQLTATVKGSQETPVWTSSAPAVATVDENGLVAALTVGEAVITASIGNVSASCTVTVTETDIPHEIEVSLDEISIFEGKDSEEITATVIYDSEEVEGEFEYTWSLIEGDEDVVSVATADNGKTAVFTGLKVGTVTYEIYTVARGYETSKEITVTVKENTYALGISHKDIVPVGNGYAASLTLGDEATDNVTFGDAYLTVNGSESEESVTVSWTVDNDNVTFAEGTVTAQKKGTSVLTGTATYNGKTLTILLTVTVDKGEETLDDTDVIEVVNAETFNVPTGVNKGEVEKIYLGNNVLFDKAAAKGSIAGNVVTVDKSGLPAKDEDLGEDKTLTIETNLMVYTMIVDVYTMIIDNAEELDMWQEVASENAVKAGICLEVQKGLAYNGYFVLSGNIEYNKEWKSYKKFGELWALCYNNQAIYKDQSLYQNGKAPDENNMVEGAIVEDWGAGRSGGFQGIFDGKGYAIEGLNVQGQYNGFITTIGVNGIVRNIAFTQAKFGEETGLIERGGAGGYVENVYVEVAEMESNAKLITMHGWTNMTNVIVNVTNCSFYGVEKSYMLHLAYVDSQNVYVIDRDYLENTKMNFETSTAPSAFLHFNMNTDKGGKFSTVEALLEDADHGKIVAGFGGYWKVEDGKLYFGDTQVVTAPARVTIEDEYKTNIEKKVTFENEAFTAGSEWTLSIDGVESTVTVEEAGKVEVEIDPATINGYRTVVILQSEEMLISYVNVIAITYISTAEELKALGVGGRVNGTTTEGMGISHVEGNDKKGYYMLADDIDCAEVGAFAAGYSWQKSYFKGVFDGNGKTISNITVNEGGIFGGMSGATVKNVNFTGVKYDTSLGNYAGNWSNYTALFAQLVNEGTVIENVNVQVAETGFRFGQDAMKEGLLFTYAWGKVVVKNVTVDASYLDLECVLGENITLDSVTFENYVIKAAGYASIGYGANDAGKPELIEWPEGVDFQTVAHLGITNTETTVTLGNSLTITTVASTEVTISLKAPVDGVSLSGNVVTVAETATPGATFTVVVATADESVERTFTILRNYVAPEHYVTDTGYVNVPQYAGNEAALGFEHGTYVFAATATTDVWNNRIIIPASSSYDYVEFDVYLTVKVGTLTAWPAKDKATKGSMVLRGGGMETSDGAIRTVQVFDANGNTVEQQYVKGFNANTLYTVRVYFNEGEDLNEIHLGTNTAQTYYIANVTWGNLTVRNDVYNYGTGALLAKYDGDVTALGFDAGSVVTKVEITDGWASRVRVDGAIKYDYVDVEFALGDNRTVSSLCIWAYKPNAGILTGNYSVTATKSEAKSSAAERKIQILDANGNAVTELKANTVYTLRVYLNGGTESAASSIAVSTFDTSADSLAIMYFGDITYGNDAN